MNISPLPDSPIDQSTLIIGFLLPPLIALIQQSHWPRDFKSVIAFAVCALAAALQLGIKGDLTGGNLLTATLAIAALSIAFYKGIWHPTGIAPAIESASDIGGKEPPMSPGIPPQVKPARKLLAASPIPGAKNIADDGEPDKSYEVVEN